MQAHIKNHNPLAMWIPCAAHSLNLVGKYTVESSTTVSSYVSFIQRLYTFYSTPKRWNVLSSGLKEAGHVVIKRLCGTRWSSHTDAVSALSDGYSIVLDVIIKMKKDNLNALSLIKLNYLYKRMNEFETVLLCKIWKALLCRINAVSNILQSNSIELMVAVNNLVALSNYMDEKRNNYEEFICRLWLNMYVMHNLMNLINEYKLQRNTSMMNH